MSTPDITTAQITAFVTFIATQAVAFGWVDDAKAQTIISVGGIIIAVALKLSDAIIRNGRAKAAGANIVE